MITSSIVIYSTKKDIEKEEELAKVVKCTSSSIIEKIYIVDNSPTTALKEFVESLSCKIIYIFNNANLGYGTAHNIAIRKSLEEGFKYHIVLNPDIYFEDRVIEILKVYMDQNQSVGAIMPQVKYPDGETQYLCKLLPSPWDLFGRRFIPFKGIVEKRNHRYELRESGYNQILNVPCLSGCFMFLRIQILENTGLFDENFFMYCEDFDFYRRIHKKYKTIFYPEVTIIHAHKKESYKNNALLRMHIKSAIHYFNKWGWFFDRDRKLINKTVLDKIHSLK
ncbi:glycosyltransferase [Dysgonomonas sp. GY617]|uniref:glycosyltransferase n=1 Tax=Dysgonomonas sp. GY617 TaxID=2780420 RepID=UPI001883B7E5|nr:glycosyltransferase [Dysgonomonas sp. GY617]MBF0576521.1 glycosyltransferase [Dysgonomonas sp. GY617]